MDADAAAAASSSSSTTTSTTAPPPLFRIPIPPCGGTAHPGGAITCTAAPAPPAGVCVLAWHSPPDNRLTAPFCRALLAALDVLEFGPHAPAVVVTTSALPRFYSNGLDLAHAVATPGFFPLLYAVWRRFLTFPVPTVALINGHAFAGGLMLAMAHDYRLAPAPRGFLCLNELLFGAPLRPAMAALFRHKLAPAALRAVALEAPRLPGPDAVALGLADDVARGLDDALAFIRRRDLVDKPKAGVYGVIKAELYKDLLAELAGPGLEAEERRHQEDQRRDDERRERGKAWYEQWRKDNHSEAAAAVAKL